MKTEKAFYGGIGFLCIAVLTCVWVYLTIYEAMLLGGVLWAVVYYGWYKETCRLLFEASSIVHYWRWGRGHKSKKDRFQLDIRAR